MTQSEEWRPVVGWEGLYEVSSLGRVRSLDRAWKHSLRGTIRRGRVLKPARVASGHLVVSLRDAPRDQREYVHRLVAEAFIPNPQGHTLVRHLDDRPDDNRAVNLAWGDYADNAQDRERNNPRDEKTHCVRDHEFTPGNTRLHKGVKICKKCNTLLAREYRKRRADR